MITYKFCPDCNNILYPKEDRKQKILLYACRNCDHREVADNFCVYRNDLRQPTGELTQEFRDAVSDPTFPRTRLVRCPKCNHGEAVFLNVISRREDRFTLFYVCCNPTCGHHWKEN